jgi:hypothetical protein
MKKIFYTCAVLVIWLGALTTVFSQNKTDAFKEFRELENKSQALIESKSIRTKTTTEIYAADGKTLKQKIVTILEEMPPDRERYTSTSEAGGVTEKYETIDIGDKTYVRLNNGKWKTLEPEDLERITGVGNSFGTRVVEEITINGQSVRVFETRSTSYFGDEERRAVTRYWFTAEGELFKTEAEEKDLKTNEISRIVTVYEYDPNIRIEAPIK